MVAASQQEPIRMTEAEYLAFEQDSDIKHEFVNGDVFAMTGASWRHNVICSNVNIALGGQLANKDCTVVASDMRLKVASRVSYRYPDLMVVCGDPAFVDDRTDTISSPTVVIEVLSASTALVDHNEKLHEYIRLTSLHEYILISQDAAQVERFLRQEADEWLYKQITGIESRLDLRSIGCTLALSDVYNKVTFNET
jgi:Uma2 family endonuclease